MGFWSALTGSDTGSTTESKSTTNVNQTQTQKGNVSQTGLTTTLDPQTIALLQGVIKGLAPSGGSPLAGQAGDIISQLTNLSNPDVVNQRVAAAQNAARMQFQTGEGSDIAVQQQEIGSRGNSFSQLLGQKGQLDLSTVLANADASIRAQAEQQHASELGAGLQGLGLEQGLQSAPLTNFLDAIKTLTGAQVTSQSQQLSDLLASMNGTTNVTSQEHNSTSKANGVIPSFTSLFG